MLVLQMLIDVPAWAVKFSLDNESFDILEQIVLNPEDEKKILSNVAYEKACAILNALEYGKDRNLLK